MITNTGGPAFPAHKNWRIDSGMTLRDYFAAHAPITIEDAMLVAGLDCSAFGMLPLGKRMDVMVALANMRGTYADAMIAERSAS